MFERFIKEIPEGSKCMLGKPWESDPCGKPAVFGAPCKVKEENGTSGEEFIVYVCAECKTLHLEPMIEKFRKAVN